MGLSVYWDAPEKLLSGKQRYFVLYIVLTLFFSNFFISFYSTANSNQSSIICNIEFEDPSFFDISINNSVFTYVKLDDCISFGKTGDPVLPVYPARILVPSGKIVSDVKVSNRPFIEIRDDLINKPVAPQQESFPFSKNIDENNFLINETLYNSQEPVFDEVYSLGDLGFCRGYKVFTIFLYPVQYIPKSGLLYYTPEITIDLVLEDSDKKNLENENIFYRDSYEDNKLISNLVENPEEYISYKNLKSGSNDLVFEFENGICDPSETYEYVIITSDSLSNTVGYEYNLSDLVVHRESYSGFNATIVTVEEISSCSDYWNQTSTFNDTQAHVREFCKDAYQDWNTEYVLLAGDWDSDPDHQIVPFRLFTDYYEIVSYDSMACDMYYSHLDGDWYCSSEDIWGGGVGSGVNDLYGELFIGRITASNAEHISNAVSKIINYDINNSLSTEWLRSSSFWGGHLGWDNVSSKQYMEELRLGTDTHRDFTGFEEFNTNHSCLQIDTSERIYDEDVDLDYPTYFENCLTNDNASIINHLDHGSWSKIFSLENWDDITNSKPFFGYSQACMSGRFHNLGTGESGCEMMICSYPDKHAYALVLNTGYGYGSNANTDGASQYLHAYFWDYFFNIQADHTENWQIGNAMAYSQDKMAAVINSNSHAWCYAWYSAHLFGDPAQKIRLNSSNTAPILENPDPLDDSVNIALNLSELSVNISDINSDSLTWNIETIPDVGNSSGVDEAGGIKICNISNLSYATEYTWYVNVTDSYTWTNESYSFTTRSLYTPDPPSSFNTNNTRFQIQLNWIDDDEADFTLVECSDYEDSTWNISDHDELYNGTDQTALQEDLAPQTIRYYKLWSYNNTDNVWSNPALINTSTTHNFAPMVSSPDPGNNSIIQNLSLNWSINIDDLENDSFNYSIQCSNNQSKSENNSDDGTKNITFMNLSYSTTYTIWVNAYDIYNISSKWYNFTTRPGPSNNSAPTVTDPNPSNDTDNVEKTLSSLSILLNDSDGDSFNWSIQTSPDIGNSLGLNATNGTKQCSVSSLSYSTNYIWYVNVTDGLNYTNKTYYFTTESEPPSPDPPARRYTPSYTPPPKNIPPTSNANGSYQGFVNQSISFDGSKSSDEDGEITEYSWNFGDGNKSSEESVNHIYLKPGNYTVKLTVTDDKDESSTDTTFANIIIDETTVEENKTDPYNPDDVIISNIDSDNDNIPDEIEKKIGSDYQSSENIISFEINGNTYCLIDREGDGEIDLVYDTVTEEISDVVIENDMVLIDVTDDGEWDYYYEISSQAYGEYSTLEKTQENKQNSVFVFKNWFIALVLCLLIFAMIIVAYKLFFSSKSEKHTYNYLTNYRLENNLDLDKVHFFSKHNKHKKISKNKLTKNQLISTSDEHYKTGSSVKNVIDDNLKSGLEKESNDLFSDEPDSFMIKNRSERFKDYAKTNYTNRHHEEIIDQIDEMINTKNKDKFKEN